jgi:mannose-6-phosphate isomerase-like protein (cupin superfamily)
MPAAVLHQSEAATVPCPCGAATRILTAAHGGPCSLHVTRIRAAERHHHRRTTEVYYILAGTGKVELDGAWHPVGPGSVVHIPAGVRHRVVADAEIETVVVAVPPFDPADEFVD